MTRLRAGRGGVGGYHGAVATIETVVMALAEFALMTSGQFPSGQWTLAHAVERVETRSTVQANRFSAG